MTAGNGLNLMLVTYKVQDTGPPEPFYDQQIISNTLPTYSPQQHRC